MNKPSSKLITNTHDNALKPHIQHICYSDQDNYFSVVSYRIWHRVMSYITLVQLCEILLMLIILQVIHQNVMCWISRSMILLKHSNIQQVYPPMNEFLVGVSLLNIVKNIYIKIANYVSNFPLLYICIKICRLKTFRVGRCWQNNRVDLVWMGRDGGGIRNNNL